MLSWFCVWCRPNEEARAAVNLSAQFTRSYLPVLDGKPLFPRYVFVQLDRDRDPWGKVRGTRGCVDLLKDGILPTPIRPGVIEAIIEYATRTPAEAQEGETSFSHGQVCRIVDGPLQGLEGLFQKDVKGRTACLLEILQRKVEVPRQSIRAA